LEDYCARCGALAEGRHERRFPGRHPANEFFCTRCLKARRAQAAVGFMLIALLLVAFVAFSWWVHSPH
jgi:hypothetical protein